MKTFRTSDRTILVEGKKYRWSGFNDASRFFNYRWIGLKCKVTKIDGDKITIYDYDDDEETTFDNEALDKINAKFVKNNIIEIIKLSIEWFKNT